MIKLTTSFLFHDNPAIVLQLFFSLQLFLTLLVDYFRLFDLFLHVVIRSRFASFTVIIVIFILDDLPLELLDILVNIDLEVIQFVSLSVLQFLNDSVGEIGHIVDARRIGTSSHEFLLHQKQVKDVSQIVVEVIAADIMSHDEIEQVFHDGLLEQFGSHRVVLLIGKVRLWFGIANFLQMLHTCLESGPDFDSHLQEVVEISIELNLLVLLHIVDIINCQRQSNE